MRTITDHVVEGDAAPQLTVTALDEPGPGGACHEYLIAAPNDPQGLESGCAIHFQNGPIKEVGMNGIQSVALLAVIIDQLRAWQAGPFKCHENAMALVAGEEMLGWLQIRTANRIARGVEGKLLA